MAHYACYYVVRRRHHIRTSGCHLTVWATIEGNGTREMWVHAMTTTTTVERNEDIQTHRETERERVWVCVCVCGYDGWLPNITEPSRWRHAAFYAFPSSLYHHCRSSTAPLWSVLSSLTKTSPFTVQAKQATAHSSSIYRLFTVGLNSSNQKKNDMKAHFSTDKHRLYCGICYRMHIEWNTKEK